MIKTVDHVQIAIPVDGEGKARKFYGQLLGLEEVPKPEPLAARGGCWFKTGGARLHLGVDPRFIPAKKAHIAFHVDNLEDVAAKLGLEVDVDTSWPGVRRFFCADPFGNRLEFMQILGPDV